MDRERIISRVRLKMEEASPLSQGEVIEDPTIDEILDETVKELLLTLPKHLIPSTAITTDISGSMGNVVPVDDKTGYIVLPADFLRLVALKMECWHRPVTEPMGEDHPDYILQRNQYTRGGCAKPKAVIRWDATAGAKVLEYYSVTDLNAHLVERADYIASTEAENLDDTLIDPLTWLVVAKVFQIMGEEEATQAKALQRVQDWITLNAR